MKNTTSIRIHFIIQILLFFLLIGLDQLFKNLASVNLKDGPDVPLIGNAVILHYLENTGAAFGIFRDHSWLFYVLTIVIFAVIFCVYLRITRQLHSYIRLDVTAFRIRTYRNMIFLCYILICLGAGAIGNLIDRIFRGYVIDFIYLQFMHFPVFNLADILVTVSAVLIVIFFIFFYNDDVNFRLFKTNSGKYNE